MKPLVKIPVNSSSNASAAPSETNRVPQENTWAKLALAFSDRFHHTQDIKDLEARLTCTTCSLMLSSIQQNADLLAIGSALHSRYELTRLEDDLVSAITILDHVRGLVDENSDDFAVCRFELGRAKLLYFRQHGDQANLDTSRDLLRGALEDTNITHPIHCRIAHMLAAVHYHQYLMNGSVHDSKEYFRLMDMTVHLCPPGHVFRPIALQGLGVAFSERHMRTGELSDLERSLELQQEALQSLTLPRHPLRYRLLNGICVQLGQRFERTGNKEDLYGAIEAGQQVLAAMPNELPPLVNLGGQLHDRYKLEGTIEGLEETIKYYRRAVRLCQPGHPHRHLVASNLASSLVDRYERTLDLVDLQEAIILYRDAIEDQAPGSPKRNGDQSNLAAALKLRFLRLSTLEDLQEAVAYHSGWLEQRPDGDNALYTWRYLYNGASLLRLRFEHLANIEDLEAAIKLLEEATQVQSEDSPERQVVLAELASAYRMRAERTSSRSDAKTAFSLQTSALSCALDGQNGRSGVLLGMAWIYLCPALPERSVQTAITFYCDAITYSYSPAQTRLAEGIKVLRALQNAV